MSSTCAGLWTADGKVEILPWGASGLKAAPSVVSFLPANKVAIGAEALASENASSTVYDAKRIIGRKFSDPKVAEECKKWPYRVVDDGNDRPQIILDVGGAESRYSPEQISAKLLEEVKKLAEARCGRAVRNAIVTVPAGFNEAQK